MAGDSRSSSGILATRSSGDEIDFAADYSLDDLPSTLSGRGALIGGLPVSEGSQSRSQESPLPDSSGDNDLESALKPPNSDSAGYVPPLLFPSFKNRAGRKRVPLQEETTPPEVTRQTLNEGPVQSLRGNDYTSIWSDSDPGWEEKFKKPSVWYSLACISVLLIGVRLTMAAHASLIPIVIFQAIIALTVATTGRKPQDGGMSRRQQELSRVLSGILGEEALMNASSPQARAYQWMIFEDTLWSDKEEYNVADNVVVQRYSLAVFYFATNGPDGWIEDNWLKSGECGKLSKWKGIECDQQGMVRAMTFGRLLTSIQLRFDRASH
jgi:hypothetical protein